MYPLYTFIGGTFAGTYAAYRLGTYREAHIWVKEKHLFGRGVGIPYYAFTTSNNQLYRIPYSILSMQLNAREIWDDIQPGAVYRIRYWGMDLPILGLYHCVDRIDVIKGSTEEDVKRVQTMSLVAV